MPNPLSYKQASRTNDQKRQDVSRLLRDGELRQWSDRYLAQMAGVSPGMVGKIRKSMSSPGLKGPFTYFISDGLGLAVKIGFSKDHPLRRMKSLQTSNPFRLKMELVIHGDLEKELHAKFSHHRIREDGEWFYFDKEIAEYIKKRLPQEKRHG